MDPQVIFAGISSVIAVICFIPYIRDIFRNETKPHSYTWFIWAVLQIIASAAMWKGGAGVAIASSLIGVVMCSFIFILSLKHATKNVTRFDTTCLFGALIALAAYFFLHNPLVSVVLVTLTDAIGFLPTFRKAYQEPDTETASTHLLSGASGVFAIVAIAHFSATTALYLVAVTIMDTACGALVLTRRKLALTHNKHRL